MIFLGELRMANNKDLEDYELVLPNFLGIGQILRLKKSSKATIGEKNEKGTTSEEVVKETSKHEK